MRISDWSSDVCSSDLDPFSRMRQSTAQTRIFARLKADHDRHRKLPTELYEMGLDWLADPFPHDEGSVHPPYRRGRGRDVPRGREGFVGGGEKGTARHLRDGEAEGKGQIGRDQV